MTDRDQRSASAEQRKINLLESYLGHDRRSFVEHQANGFRIMSLIANERLGVVIMDDDPVFLEWICATVAKKSNFMLFSASNRPDFFEILSRERIDCIVLDYDLGDVSGLAIKQILDDDHPDHPPTIMVTGDGRERTAITAFRMGVDDYLPKRNLKPEFVIATILKIVEKHRRNARLQIEHGRFMRPVQADQLVDPLDVARMRA